MRETKMVYDNVIVHGEDWRWNITRERTKKANSKK